MFAMSKINFRRILVVFLVQITLFLGLAFSSGSNAALAVTGDDRTQNKEMKELVNEAKYESAKEKRREAQAERSELAKEKAEPETIEEKLNLEELTSGNTETNQTSNLH